MCLILIIENNSLEYVISSQVGASAWIVYLTAAAVKYFVVLSFLPKTFIRIATETLVIDCGYT